MLELEDYRKACSQKLYNLNAKTKIYFISKSMKEMAQWNVLRTYIKKKTIVDKYANN